MANYYITISLSASCPDTQYGSMTEAINQATQWIFNTLGNPLQPGNVFMLSAVTILSASDQ